MTALVFVVLSSLLLAGCAPPPEPVARVATEHVEPSPSPPAPEPETGPCSLAREVEEIEVWRWTPTPDATHTITLRCPQREQRLESVQFLERLAAGQRLLIGDDRGVATLDLQSLERGRYTPIGPVALAVVGERMVVADDGHVDFKDPLETPPDDASILLHVLSLPAFALAYEQRIPGRLIALAGNGSGHVVVKSATYMDELNWHVHVRLIELETGKVIVHHQASASTHHGTQVVFSPDNRWMVTADNFELVQLEEIASGSKRELIRAVPARNPLEAPLSRSVHFAEGDRVCVTEGMQTHVFRLLDGVRIEPPRGAEHACVPGTPLAEVTTRAPSP